MIGASSSELSPVPAASVPADIRPPRRGQYNIRNQKDRVSPLVHLLGSVKHVEPDMSPRSSHCLLM